MKNCKNELLIIIISVVTYANLTILLVNVHIDSGYLVVLIENETENGIFQIDGAGHAPSLYTKYW